MYHKIFYYVSLSLILRKNNFFEQYFLFRNNIFVVNILYKSIVDNYLKNNNLER